MSEASSNEKWLQDQSNLILDEVLENFPHFSGKLEGTIIRMSRRLTRSAGNACPKTRTIGISEPIFSLEENIGQFRNTVLHELAHVIAGPDVRPHGKIWRRIFLELGGDGERCHQLRARGQHHSHVATCQRCQQDVMVGTRIWNRLNKGCKDYYHQGCRGIITVAGIDAAEDVDGWWRQLGRKLSQAVLFSDRDSDRGSDR
ncbi:MAG: SprT-like domain-containing protein, partial [Planctomycetota bacterium]|nr:SprT-like domain-containing protein [Planctomycetota bacterium]